MRLNRSISGRCGSNIVRFAFRSPDSAPQRNLSPDPLLGGEQVLRQTRNVKHESKQRTALVSLQGL